MPVAVITGASTGIGRELAHLCARDGYDLVLVARSPSKLEAVATEIRDKKKQNVLVIAKDLTRPEAAGEVFEQVNAAALPVEILINNAGFGLLGHFWELDLGQQMQMVQLNVAALTELSRLFLPGFIAQRRGRIMNLASTAAFQPGPLMAVYYASKAYVVSFSEAINNEARDFGVTVTCLCPGPTRTEFHHRAGLSASIFEGGLSMTAKQVASQGYAAMKAGKPLIVTGRLNAAMAFLARFPPLHFTAAMARRFQEKK